MVSRPGIPGLCIVALAGIPQLHAQPVEAVPDGFCLEPPLVMERTIAAPRSAVRQGTPARPEGIAVPAWAPGDILSVRLTVLSVRPSAPSGCQAPVRVTVVETLPRGWIPHPASDGGTHDAETGKLTWELGPEDLYVGKRLEYFVPAADTVLTCTFAGTVVEGVPLSPPARIEGPSTLERHPLFAGCGALRTWNVLGPFASEAGVLLSPEAMRADYLTDGVTGERDFAWFPGAWLETDFGRASAATSLLPNASGWNPLDVPTAAGWTDLDGSIDLNDVYGPGQDPAMAYAQTHVVNETAGPMAAILRVSLDGAGEVLLNGELVVSTSLAEGRQVCGPLDGLTRPLVLAPGENSLMVKVFAGRRGFGFALRFEDEAAEPITEGLRSEHRTASNPCPYPPILAVRRITAPAAPVECRAATPTYATGGSYRVELTLGRGITEPACPEAASLIEKLPPGWTAADISDGGVFAEGMITWRLAAPLPFLISYTATAGGPAVDVLFAGVVEDPLFRRHVDGDARLSGLFSEQGFVRRWLLLGPYRQPPGLAAMPGLPALRADHLTDGDSIFEAGVEPQDGDMVDTAYGPQGPARSVGFAGSATPGACSAVSLPTWKEWRDRDDTIDFGDFYGGDLDEVMMYAVTYFEVETATVADLGLASSDSVQVLLDGEEIHIRNAARALGPAGEVQDLIRASEVPALSPLTPGVHRLMVKVFEGFDEHGFRLRFQDPATGDPITEGLEICSDFTVCSTVEFFRRGDVDGSRVRNITDAIRILNFLFRGGPRPTCPDTADVDDSGRLEITDAVHGLCLYAYDGCNVPPPGPATCGPDPTPDNLGPCAYDC